MVTNAIHVEPVPVNTLKAYLRPTTVYRELGLLIKKSDVPIPEKKITSSRDAYNIFLDIWPVDLELREAFVVLGVDRANQYLGHFITSLGSVSGTIADPKMIYQHAMLMGASGIIIAHNHPSGQARPSGEDITHTKKIVEAGKLLDLPTLDHLIITKNSYYSFADMSEL